MQIWSLIIPGLVAIIGNLIFYRFVKKRIDKSIEQYKISYSGIFKEKIDIYREILKQLFQLRLKIEQYQISGSIQVGEELFSDFNNFIHFYSINQPFLRKEILDGLTSLRKEYQGCFDSAYQYYGLRSFQGIKPEQMHEAFNKFGESINKFRIYEPMGHLQDLIISEMRSDLGTDELSHKKSNRVKNHP